MNLIEKLIALVSEIPQEPAIIEKNTSITFGALNEATERAVCFFRAKGLKAGRYVLVLQPMSIDLYIALLAFMRMGVIAQFLDPSAGKNHIEQCCAMRPPDAFFAKGKAHLLRLNCSALRRISLKFSVGFPMPGSHRWERYHRFERDPVLHPCDETFPALMTFTSGSTGRPKAAIRTHGFLMEQHRVLEKSIALKRGETDLATLPVFALANLASGITTLIPDCDITKPGFIDAKPVFRQINACKPNRSAASPAFFECLLAHAKKSGDRSTLRSFSKIYTGGAPVFPDLLHRMQEALPDARVTAVYGSTEAEPIAHFHYETDSKPPFRAGLPAGRPVDEIQCRVIKDCWGSTIEQQSEDSFAELSLQPEEKGEIVVTGNHVLKEYFTRDVERETKFKVGDTVWHRTGDAGVFLKDGTLWLLGRCQAKCEIEGNNWYPLEVETVVQQIDGIPRCAFFSFRGKPTLVLEVRPKSGNSMIPLVKKILQEIGIPNLPIVRIDKIPMDKRHNAKIDYRELTTSLSPAG